MQVTKSRRILTLPASFTHRDINGLGRLSEWQAVSESVAASTAEQGKATHAVRINQRLLLGGSFEATIECLEMPQDGVFGVSSHYAGYSAVRQ